MEILLVVVEMAQVTEAEEVHSQNKRMPPKEVWRACYLIVASLLLSPAILIPGVTPNYPGVPATPLFESLAAFALFGGLTLWLGFKVLQRKNWARWAMFVYLALTWLLSAQTISEELSLSPMAGLIEVLCNGMEMVAVVYLFFGQGAMWFEPGTPG